MSRLTHTETTAVELDPHGEVTTRTWSPEVLREHIKSWPLLETDKERLHRIRELDDSLAESITTTTNIAVDGLLEGIATTLNPTDSETVIPTHLALGTDNTAPESTNVELNNEVYRSIVGDADTDGFDLLTSTFLSQTEANGEVIVEVGLVAGQSESAPLLTHAVFSTDQRFEKKSSRVITIDYILELRRPRR